MTRLLFLDRLPKKPPILFFILARLVCSLPARLCARSFPFRLVTDTVSTSLSLVDPEGDAGRDGPPALAWLLCIDMASEADAAALAARDEPGRRKESYTRNTSSTPPCPFSSASPSGV